MCRAFTFLTVAFAFACSLFSQIPNPDRQALLHRKTELLESIKAYEKKEAEAQSTLDQAAMLRKQADSAGDSQNAAIASQAMDVAKEAIAKAQKNAGEDKERLEVINRQLSALDTKSSVEVAKIVRGRQSELQMVDEEIKRTQARLQQLIRRARLDSGQREDWAKEVEEAANNAKVLSLNLTLDLLQVRAAQQLGDATKELGSNLAMISSGTGAADATRREGLHTAFAALKNRREELQRIGKEFEIATNLEGIRERIEILEGKREESTPELIYDAADQLTKLFGKDLGPAKDLVDSAYTMSQEAVGMWHLAKVPDRSNEYLATSEKLSKQIQGLVAKQKSLRETGSTASVPER